MPTVDVLQMRVGDKWMDISILVDKESMEVALRIVENGVDQFRIVAAN